MDGNSNDAVGTNNGTDTAITYGVSNGKKNQGALFVRASASKINLPSFNLNTASNPWSAQAWIKTTSASSGTDQYSIISRRTGTNTFALAIFGPSNFGVTNKVQLSDWGVTNTRINTEIINDGKWHYIVVTSSNNTSAKIYTNGILTNSSTAFSFVTQTITNGNNIGNFDTGGRCWDGSIDEVGYYSVELNSSQIKNNYAFHQGFYSS